MSVLFEVPQLMVGFDIETTGLDTQTDEAVSYGFAEFNGGELIGLEEFFVLPEVQIHPGAERIHGTSYEKLRRMHREGTALSSMAGASRAAQRLIEYHSRGATFVGANVVRFDFTMLDSTLRRHGVQGLNGVGFDLSEVSIVDVVTHDRIIDSDFVARPRRGQDYLCDYYGVASGGHDAAEDARAACEVLIAQVANVQRQFTATSHSGSKLPGDDVSNRVSSWTRVTRPFIRPH